MAEIFRITTAQSYTVKNESMTTGVSIVKKGESTEGSKSQLKDIINIASSDSSIENQLNAKRMQSLKSAFSAKLLQLLREQDFEYGVDTPADELVRKCFKENESITKQWLNDLFIQNFADQTIIIGILRVLSHFDYDDIAPQGPTIALAALTNSNAEIRESGIRAFENWCTLESLNVLKQVQCVEEWLNDYLQQVITDLTEELRGNAIAY